jgi:hypothetical protein
VVTRESTLRENFDPIVFHRSAAMAQSGWAEHEARKARSFQDKIGRFAGTITFLLGLLLIVALRPPNLMDLRDVSVSAVAIGACLVVGMVGSKIVMSVFRTSVEVDRIVMWAVSLVIGLAVASLGLVPTFARDADDYIHEIPGYTMTLAPSFDSYDLVDKSKGVFTDAEVWSLEAAGQTVGAVGVYVIEDGSKRGASKLMSDATGGAAIDPHRAVLGGETILVSNTGSRVQLGHVEDSALVIVAGSNRSKLEPVAASLFASQD